jgi:nitrite reductase/ring-hydroxylating ferredoxin subunit
MGEFVRVAAVDEVKPGQGLVAEVNGKALAVFNIDGQIHVIDNTCAHRGGPSVKGSWKRLW